MRIVTLILLLASPLGSWADDNKVDGPFDQNLERVFQRVLGRAEKEASKIAGPLSKGDDPKSAVSTFESFMKDKFGTDMTKACENLGQNLIRDEQSRYKDLEKLLTVAGRLSAWRTGTTSRTAVLKRGLAKLGGRYDDIVGKMDKAAKDDVLDTDEQKEFAKKFEDIQAKARALIEKWDEDGKKLDDSLTASLEKCGGIGKELAKALEEGSEALREDRDEIEERTYAHVLDWRGGRSPSGVRFVRYTKDANAQFVFAKKELKKSIDLWTGSKGKLTRATINNVINDLTRRAGAEIGLNYNFPGRGQFTQAQKRIEKLVKEIREKTADLLDNAEGTRDAGKKQIAADLERLLPLASTEDRKKELRREVERADKSLADAANHGKDLTKEGATLNRQYAILNGRIEAMDLMIGVIQRYDTSSREVNAILSTLPSVTGMALSTAKGAIGGFSSKLEKLDKLARDVKFLSDLKKHGAVFDEHGLVWTESGQAELAFGYFRQVAKVVTPFGSVISLAESVEKSHKVLRALWRQVSTSTNLLDDCISDPDKFAEDRLTQGIYDYLDKESYKTLKELREKTTDGDFNALTESPEGKKAWASLVKPLDKLTRKLAAAKDTDSRLLARALQTIRTVIATAFDRSAADVNDTFDSLVVVVEKYRDERQDEREDNREAFDKDIDDLSDRIEALSKDGKIDDNRKKELDGWVGDAEDALDELEKIEEKADSNAYEGQRQTVEDAIGKVEAEVAEEEKKK